ncbi:hypothetical protein SBA3_3450012 [Candidatus Sulfopaludibacter sp. SbA3]|nr:hypothetical protein SBA3_3450012 [Candidatus Sulfopaludibacter sp. SbA3]
MKFHQEPAGRQRRRSYRRYNDRVLAGYRFLARFSVVRSNLCTRHILFGLEPRGHHDWPYKRVIRPKHFLSCPTDR